MAGLLGLPALNAAIAAFAGLSPRKDQAKSLLDVPAMTLRDLSRYVADTRQEDRYWLGADRSVMPEVRDQAQQRAMHSAMDYGGLLGMAKGIPTGIQSAAVKVGDKTYLGSTHGQAINKALYDGAVIKANGRFIPAEKGADINWDLFLTNDGQLIDRLTADALIPGSAGASETSLERGVMKQQPARKLADGLGGMSPELSLLLYGP